MAYMKNELLKTEAGIIPSDPRFEQYYQLWKSGVTESEILSELDISRVQFRKSQALFFNYVRDRMRQELCDNTFVLEKTPEREEEFLSLVSAGLDWPRACRILNIPLNTLVDFWFKDDSFKARVDYCVEMATAKVIAGLYRRASGEVRKLRSVSEGSQGRMVTEREEYVSPSVDAAKFILINREPEKWTLEGNPTPDRDRALILSALDKISE